ncbi:MAG TPA: PP2C family serine/threonine-protein phosphatase [Terriglobales bacterium]|jgi:protein phosphatase|nr:PP2C family serine/threonine-protein phosphatase [Terriglobales bacterium]
MQIRPGIKLAGLSDVGCQRENNEDKLAYWEAPSDEEFARKGRLLSVADGMGGHEGGAEASRIAVETVEEIYRSANGSDIRAILLKAFQTAHQRILEYADAHPGLQGMGTTCTAVVLRGLDLYYAHIGDSRLYLAREEAIYRLTRDQSYVGKLVEQGIISTEEAGTHPQRHILTSALGAGAEVIPECPEEPLSLESADVLVLCTDGLWSLLAEADVQKVVMSKNPEDACKELVKMARDEGGPDNITVQVAQVD